MGEMLDLKLMTAGLMALAMSDTGFNVSGTGGGTRTHMSKKERARRKKRRQIAKASRRRNRAA